MKIELNDGATVAIIAVCCVFIVMFTCDALKTTQTVKITTEQIK